MSEEIKLKNIKSDKYQIDMVNGPIFSKILLFSIPLMLSGILQLLFNAADLIIIGKYSTTNALAAVGATSSLVNFFTNVIIGVSVGANVIVARYIGAGRDKEVHDAVHTSIAVCILLGIVVGAIAFITCTPILKLMKTPDEILGLAALYVKIYFAGLPAMVIYNFGSAILRATGDTQRPLLYLSLAGILNVLLNVIFVTQFGMSVDGVALATVLSQALSAFLVIRCLMTSSENYKLILKELKIDWGIFAKILQIGLPAGIQGMLFSISNILIQSSINLFGGLAMAGSTACQSLEGFVYTSMNAIYQTNLSFTSQNYGAGKYDRIKKILIECVLLVTVTGLILGNLVYLFSSELLGLYTSDAEAIKYRVIRVKIICTTYCTCGLMEVFCGSLRGLGYGILPMIVSLIGACFLRVVWIKTIFEKYMTLEVLYMSYPVTWVITIIAHATCLAIIWNRRFKKNTL